MAGLSMNANDQPAMRKTTIVTVVFTKAHDIYDGYTQWFRSGLISSCSVEEWILTNAVHDMTGARYCNVSLAINHRLFALDHATIP